VTSLTSTTFGAALVRGFFSEDWARGTLELPALATWHLLCQLTLDQPFT